MSFDKLKVAELKTIATEFAVDTEGLKNKQDIIAAMAEEGVTWDVYQATIKDVAENTEEIEILPKFNVKDGVPADSVLVRMTRANMRYDILGYTFTKDHPFVAMPEDNAQKIFDKEGGFRLATPKEVQEFYG
jgi:hypothetical protein